MDTRKRSWVKSIVWRILGIIILGLISFLVTGSWKQMTVITVLFHGIRVILYYLHERIWLRISWGTIKHPLARLPLNREPTPEDFKIIEQKLRDLGYID